MPKPRPKPKHPWGHRRRQLAPQYLSTSFWESVWQRHMLGASVPALAIKLRLSPARIKDEFKRRGWHFRLAGPKYYNWAWRSLQRLSIATGLSPQKILFVWAVHMSDPDEIKANWADLVEDGIATDFGETGVNESVDRFKKELAKIGQRYQGSSWLDEDDQDIEESPYRKDH